LTIANATSASNSADKSMSVSCTGGKKVLGGGFTTTSVKVGARDSYPSATDAWSVHAVEFVSETTNWSVTVYAICA
jgi:hypothetical protein